MSYKGGRKLFKPNFIVSSLLTLLFWLPLFPFSNHVVLANDLFPFDSSKGSYWVDLSFNENDSIVGKFSYVSYDFKELNLDSTNLAIKKDLIQNGDIYRITPDYFKENSTIRIELLRRGFCSLVNDSIATKEEIDAQNESKTSNLGLWSKPSIFKRLVDWIITNKEMLIKIASFIFGPISLIALIKLIQKLLKRKEIIIHLYGEPASGKTAVLKRFTDPICSEYDIQQLKSSPTEDIKGMERIAYKNLDLYPQIIDNPGREYGKMLGNINRCRLKHKRKLVAVLILAPTSNFSINKEEFKIDTEYLKEQLAKLCVQADFLKKSRKPVDRIILFVNKCDLLTIKENEMEKALSTMKPHLKGANFELLSSHCDETIWGSALKNWEIEKLRKSISDVYK